MERPQKLPHPLADCLHHVALVDRHAAVRELFAQLGRDVGHAGLETDGGFGGRPKYLLEERGRVVDDGAVIFQERDQSCGFRRGDVDRGAGLHSFREPSPFAGPTPDGTKRRHHVLQVIHLIHAVSHALVDVHPVGNVSRDRHAAGMSLTAHRTHVLLGQ